MEIATGLGIESQVEFIGRLSRLGVMEEMQLADSFILSSNSETFGVVLIEALSQGLPVISTSCGGPIDIVSANNGLLVAPGDLQGLASAMQTMFEHAASFDRESIMRGCFNLYGQASIVSKYLDFYGNAIKQFNSEQSAK
jgi:glycosyltransferase involved in cell wall biosynthesis